MKTPKWASSYRLGQVVETRVIFAEGGRWLRGTVCGFARDGKPRVAVLASDTFESFEAKVWTSGEIRAVKS